MLNIEQYDIGMERTVLSSLINEPRLIDIVHSDLKKDELFFYKVHKDICRILLGLHENDEPIDEVYINTSLIRDGIDAVDALTAILITNPSANVLAYINALQERADKRNVLSMANALQNDLEQDHLSATQILNKTIDRIERLYKTNRIELMTLQDITDIQPEEAKFICADWLPFPKKTVSMISSPGGKGKSWLVLQIMMRYLIESPSGKAYAWLSEDPSGLAAYRAQKIASNILHTPLAVFKERLFISNGPTIQFLNKQQRGVEVNPFFSDMKRLLSPYNLIIFDPLIAFYGADENDNSNARKFLQLFTDWASKEDKTIIFIHHSSKNTTQARGASAFSDAVRLVYEIVDSQSDIKEYERHFFIRKDNYGAREILKSSSVTRQVFPRLLGDAIKLTPIISDK